MPTLRELGEFEIIRRLPAARGGSAPAERGAPPVDPLAGRAGSEPPAGIVIDAGDDAAVLRPTVGFDLVATTDVFVEGEHFLPEWTSPREAGARLAQANLSDLAAMAAVPRWALLSIGARPETQAEELIALQGGLAATLAAAGAALVGGNLTAVSGAEWYSLTLLGECEPHAAWTRSGARPGDLLAVSGRVGRAGAAVRLVRGLGEGARAPEWAPLLDAWRAPISRVALARALRERGGVRAAIDVSDGFVGDLAHLCESSGVGAEVDATAWPEDPLLARAAGALGLDEETIRFGPSDDYELILAIEPAARAECERIAAARGVPLSIVGRFTGDPGVLTLLARDRARPGAGVARPLPGKGYDHFGA